MNVDWTLAGAVMLSGLVIVFLGLIILIALVYLVNTLIGSAQKKRTPPPNAAKEAPKAAPAPTAAPAPVVQAGIEEETVAVISAAVASIMADTAPGSAYAVSSISRGRQSRPVWGFAGMQQNTRPF